MTIPEILQQKYPPEYLKGFKKGWFDPSITKLYAYSVLLTGDEDFTWETLSINGYSYFGIPSDEPFRIYDNDGSFQYKQISQLVQEDIFKWCCIRFYGIFFKECWYLKSEFMFSTEEAKGDLESRSEVEFHSNKDFWEGHYFQVVPKFRSEIDYDALNKELSDKYGEKVNVLADPKKLISYLHEIDRAERPMKDELQYNTYRQFVGLPWLVAYDKEERKRKINETFHSYMTHEIFFPFALALRNKSPDEFYKIVLLNYGGFLDLIYPNSKSQVLAGMEVADKVGNSKLWMTKTSGTSAYSKKRRVAIYTSNKLN